MLHLTQIEKIIFGYRVWNSDWIQNIETIIKNSTKEFFELCDLYILVLSSNA